MIAPLYGGKTALEVVGTLAGRPGEVPYDIVREYWQAQLKSPDFEIAWAKALHDGVVPNTALPTVNVTAKAPQPAPPKQSQGMEVMFRPDPTIWDGSPSATTAGFKSCPSPRTK
jgi:hypothetical protein